MYKAINSDGAGMEVHAYNLSTEEAGTGRLPQFEASLSYIVRLRPT